ncbi:hypothetical protein C7460_108165 [Marinoscillum furvescens DSM 4134]|uniref:Glycosyl transferase family 2 n=2 Tax=Marinoscillum furvescens TaxID=1026 RepID=A0A3D9L3B9_MARFU|nr:hypothetical protein C7460_108165 [Marinoscillum furvescens DSM 4134]
MLSDESVEKTLREDVLVVHRALNERTKKASRILLEDIFSSSNIIEIGLVPFAETVKEGLKKGIESKKKWLLCIDADVLVSKEGIKKLFENACLMHENVFEIQGLILDKFFGILRPAGNHLYRVELCHLALNKIPDSLRPETDMMNQMALDGYPRMQCDALVGIHDFEQHYLDIYKKCFLQAKKHRTHRKELRRFWADNTAKDFDFVVALLGEMAGSIYENEITVDAGEIYRISKSVINIDWLPEKSKNYSNSDLVKYVKEKIDSHDYKSVKNFQEKMFPQSRWNRIVDFKILRSQNRPSFLKKVVYKIGLLLEKVGAQLKLADL